MNHKLLALLIGAAALLVAACAALTGPRDIDVPLATLQETLDRRFPLNNRFLDVFDVTVSNPRLSLEPETNRVLMTFDASIRPPFVNRTWKGSLALSGSLALDQGRSAVMLAEPRVDNFAIEGVDPVTTRQISRIGGLLAEQLLRDVPVYTFRPDQFRYAGVTFFPTKIATKSTGLVVTFEPAK
ncbi:MAG: hypothetical protein JWQ23_3106 [Herminiimonas sp.]|jgi:hypothetical protein|nr:hypothetical protein [Herminiimonas sp.]